MRILIANPPSLVADALRSYVAGADGMEILATCSAPEEAIERTSRLQPEIVVTTGCFPGVDKAGYVRALKEASETSAIVVVCTDCRGDFMWALDAGAAGYVGPDCLGPEFIDTLSKIARGELVVCGVDRKTATSGQTTDTRVAEALHRLTPREREVLELLSRGLSNREIAREMYVSEHTVRTHIQNLRAKLKVRSKFEAAVMAMQAGTQF